MVFFPSSSNYITLQFTDATIYTSCHTFYSSSILFAVWSYFVMCKCLGEAVMSQLITLLNTYPFLSLRL